ncbi:unnamed protein product [Adineta ricciae]|uniref:Uncharacterized protein n=1 Tax=Adineta ricciae TaxID=249248 RepID=A0A814FM38_ADIRI|nr:unnamed protein product [Adineta ricciae]
MNTGKPLVFCLDKSNNSNLKQCLNNFTPRFFTDSKYLLKSIVVNAKAEFIVSALILTGDFYTIKDILFNPHCHSMKSFVFCQNLTRQTYESLMKDSADRIIGLFTTIEDLKDALEDVLIKPIAERQLIRLITNNLESYLWYEFLKQTAAKIDTVPLKQPVDVANVNRQIEFDPLLTLYKLRSSIRDLKQRTSAQKKVFYGTVVKKELIDALVSNTNNLMSFNSFVHLQGHTRALDARHQSLQCCSRRSNEVSVLFELELADQPTFKIIRIFNSANDKDLWVVQLVGTHECVKVSKQFSRSKLMTSLLSQWEQPEILFGQILVAMNEINKAYSYFFDTIINRYDQLSKIYTNVHRLWEEEQKYNEVVDLIATEFRQIKPLNALNKNTIKRKEETTYLESEFDSTWETPIALQDEKKINDLLPPISYRVDNVLCKPSTLQLALPSSSLSTSKRCCTLF